MASLKLKLMERERPTRVLNYCHSIAYTWGGQMGSDINGNWEVRRVLDLLLGWKTKVLSTKLIIWFNLDNDVSLAYMAFPPDATPLTATSGQGMYTRYTRGQRLANINQLTAFISSATEQHPHCIRHCCVTCVLNSVIYQLPGHPSRGEAQLGVGVVENIDCFSKLAKAQGDFTYL